MLSSDLDRATDALRGDGPPLTVEPESDGVAGLGGHGAVILYRESAGGGDDLVVTGWVLQGMRQQVDGAVAGIPPRRVPELVGGVSTVSAYMDDDAIVDGRTVELPFTRFTRTVTSPP